MVEKLEVSAVKYCLANEKLIGDYERVQIIATGTSIEHAQQRFDSQIPKEAEVIIDHHYRLIGEIQELPSKKDLWQETGFALIKK
jgi:hypothetical protein